MIKSTFEAVFKKLGKMHPILKLVLETKKDPRKLGWPRYQIRRGKYFELLGFVVKKGKTLE